jgi:hypothetical protein
MSEENLRASMNLREKQELLDSVFDFMRGPWENRGSPFLPAIFYPHVIQKADAGRSDVLCGSKSYFEEHPRGVVTPPPSVILDQRCAA